MKRKGLWLYILIGIIIATSAVLLILYFRSTFNPKLSTDSSVWAEFGAFLSPLVSLITMIILLIDIQENRKSSNDFRIIEERKYLYEKLEQITKLSLKLCNNWAKYYHTYKQLKEYDDMLIK